MVCFKNYLFYLFFPSRKCKNMKQYLIIMNSPQNVNVVLNRENDEVLTPFEPSLAAIKITEESGFKFVSAISTDLVTAIVCENGMYGTI